jgi:alpha-galactosidase
MRVPLVKEGIDIELEWRLLVGSPLLLWRASLLNRSSRAIEVKEIELFRSGEAWEGAPRSRRSTARIRPGRPAWDWGASGGELAFYSNGWQSWSFAGALSAGDRFPRTRLGPLTSPMRVNEGTPHPLRRGRFSADFYGVLGSRKARTGVLVGFLSQRQAFGSLEARIGGPSPSLRLWANGDHARLDPGARLLTDWACLQFVDLDGDDPLGPYLDAVAAENSARSSASVPVGWCSWYYFFQNVSQDDVAACLSWAEEHRGETPLSLIQIDDGFQAEVGDWLETNARFGDGMTALQERIRGAGFQPGLWLAPFVAKPGARVVQEHPDWLLYDRQGRPANAGLIWNTRTRALDPTHPAVLEHIERLIRTATHKWGFDYLKLDFLYAGALAGQRHDPTVTRAQALRRCLEVIREAAGPDAFLVGCGCPLGSGIGVFDAMRISSDVAPRWKPAYLGIEPFFQAEPDFPSARNAIRNVLTRAHLHRRWWVNDPDCLLLRKQTRSGPGEGRKPAPKEAEQHLAETEVQCLATAIALSAGSLIVSDHLPELGPERLAWLGRLLPPLPRAARVLDWFDRSYPTQLLLPLSGAIGEWALMALINWQDRPQTLEMDLASIGLMGRAPFHLVDFWRGEYQRLESPHLSVGVPPHGAALMAVRPVTQAPGWVGDTLHVSQGLIVERWSVDGPQLSAGLALSHNGSGTAFVALPAPPITAQLDSTPVGWREVGGGVYAFELSVGPRSVFRVSWG